MSDVQPFGLAPPTSELPGRWDYVLNQSWPAQLLKSLVSGFMAPGDAYQGNFDPLSPEGVRRAADMAGLTALGAPASGLQKAAQTIESKSAFLHNPMPKPSRPLELDYPHGAVADEAGRLQFDIEGRPLIAERVVGRNVVGQGEKALSPEELVAVAESAIGASPQTVAQKTLGRAVARSEFDPHTGRPLGLLISNRLTEAQASKVLGHELGHVIDQLAGEIPTTGLSRELTPLYDALTTGRERRSNFTGPQHAGYSKEEVPREFMAEAIRAYLADPNSMKTVAPKTAAAIRAAVNGNPQLNKVIQFNASSLPFSIGGPLPYDPNML